MPENKLSEWEKSHKSHILQELQEAGITLTLENIPRIIEETSFRVRSIKHPGECPYYQKNPPITCHTEVEDLNCFLCACPNYNSSSLVGGCKINSKRGKITEHPNLPEGRVWDCTDCSINHAPNEVRRYLEKMLQG